MFAIPRLTPFVKGLLIALIAIYVGVAIIDVWVLSPSDEEGSRTLFGWLALTPGDLGIHTLWQVATYPWVEPPVPQAVIGFLIGLLFVWWMLSPFEERFGAPWVAKLCAVATISGAIPAIFAAVIFPSAVPLYGSWVWALAALAAFAAINWSAQVSFFGVIPMRAWVMLAIAIGIAVLQFITSRDVPSFVAQLGAIGGGYLWAKWWMRPRTKPKKRAKSRGNGNRPAFRIIQGGREEEEDDDDSGPRDRPRWLN